MKNLNGFKVFFFKGTPLMPNLMILPGKLLVRRGTPEEKYVRSLIS